MEIMLVRPSVATQQSRGEIVMKRLRILFLLTAVLLFGTHSVFAADFAVGTCEPKLVSFSTISAAVAAVPSGSIVEVCPGFYPEQVNISKALTLEGITSGSSDQAIIAVPAAGLVLDASGFAVQVEVTAGPVNITNMTVDGFGNNLGGSASLIGIFYGDGASGVIKDVTTRNQVDSGRGLGIFASNTNSTSESVTIEDCSIHDFDFIGIEVEGKLTATVKANHVNGSNATALVFGIIVDSAGSITGNAVTGPGPLFESEGIDVSDAFATVSDNIVTNWEFGIVDFEPASLTANTVWSTSEAIFLQVAGATVESNAITQASNTGIDFDCHTGTVKSNTINAAQTGINNVPSGLSSTNTYFIVGAIRTACSGADLRKGMEMPRKPPTPDRP
jgi:hypothetical protein